MKDCVFCKIINKEMATKFVHEDEDIIVINDINPKAKVHLLIVPRQHVKTFLDLKDSHYQLLTNLIKVVQRLVVDKKLQSGYRVVINGGRHQKIGHLHLHLLGD